MTGEVHLCEGPGPQSPRKPGKNEVASLKATIEKDSANIATQTSTIEDLASSIATDEADLKAATEIRDKENADLSAQEKNLVETIDIVERAVGIIEKEMAGGAAMVQGLTAADSKQLTALVRSGSEEDSEGAPDPEWRSGWCSQ